MTMGEQIEASPGAFLGVVCNHPDHRFRCTMCGEYHRAHGTSWYVDPKTGRRDKLCIDCQASVE